VGLAGCFRARSSPRRRIPSPCRAICNRARRCCGWTRSLGFRRSFADPSVDALQRLEDAGSIEAAYKIYQKNVKIAYDPTEGIIKLEVSAPDPELSAAWSRELISYAEEQVNHLSERLRSDSMKGARDSYEEAERKLLAAQDRVLELQEANKVLSSQVEVSLMSSQITGLETQLSQDRLSLAQMLSNPNPNRARVEPVQRRIATLEDEIRLLRARLTGDGAGGRSLARVQSELLVAETDVATRQLLLQQAAQQLGNRPDRGEPPAALSVGVGVAGGARCGHPIRARSRIPPWRC
jgi:capsular polysaccharide transport system permease protein